MIGLRYVDELFAIYRIPREFWKLIKEDLRYEGNLRRVEGFLVFLSLPILASSSVIYFKVNLANQFFSLLIAAATLFVGFSMNSVLLLLRYSSKEDASPLLVDQTRNLISYLLYLGVLLGFLGLLGYIVSSESISPPQWLEIAVAAISVFALIHFLVVVLFLPARIFTIIERSTE